MRSGWTRSVHTGSISDLIYAIGIRSNGREKNREGSPEGDVDGEVQRHRSFNGGCFPVVFGFREGDDGVQILEARTMSCSMGYFVSCNGEGGWMELGGATVMHRAWRNTASTKGSRRWRPYQMVQGEEASSMAKSSSPECSGGPAIARRRFDWRR
jgi:hypothetical protein